MTRPAVRVMRAVMAFWPACCLMALSPDVHAAAGGARAFDFNGDGRPDFVQSAPDRGVADTTASVQQGAGEVVTALATRDGRFNGRVTILQQLTGAQQQAGYGSSFASGDFNGDGFADLAIGAPSAQAFTASDGIVDVYYGSAHGLARHHGATELNGYYDNTHTERGEHLGESLAVADFNHDGYADLAVGVPDAAVSGHLGAGKVLVFAGGGSGLYNGHQSGAGLQVWSEDSPNVVDHAEGPVMDNSDPRERFGAALGAGDVNGDNHPDLIIGVSGEYTSTSLDPIGESSAGAIEVLLGSGSGLTSSGNQMWNLDSHGVAGDTASYEDSETGDVFYQHFGAALTVGDFNHDGHADVAVGIPDMQVGTHEDLQFHGAVSIFAGSQAGLKPSRYIDLSAPNVPGKLANNRHFGSALATGDFNGDGYGDLAVGAPGNHRDNRVTTGSTTVLFGGRHGLSGVGQRITQDTRHVPGKAEEADEFGWSLRGQQLVRGHATDLMVGTPGEDTGGATDSGAVLIIPGSTHGRLGAHTRSFVDSDFTQFGPRAPGDEFGFGTSTTRRIGNEGSTV